jgi:hypothetical protein
MHQQDSICACVLVAFVFRRGGCQGRQQHVAPGFAPCIGTTSSASGGADQGIAEQQHKQVATGGAVQRWRYKCSALCSNMLHV